MSVQVTATTDRSDEHRSEEALAADTLLRQTRWSVREVGHVELMAGHSRRLGDAGLRFLYVAQGNVTVTRPGASAGIERAAELVDLRRGDFALLPQRGGERLVRTSPGVRARLVTGRLTLDATPFERLADLLPPVLLHCGSRIDDPTYEALLEMLDAETSKNGGTSPLLRPLLDLVVSATLRAFFERGCASAREWLAQLRDPIVGPALAAIHAEPGSPWTLDALARVARASRSQLAERFRVRMGQSPAKYVNQVRMRRAEELLRAGEPVSQVAFALGYDSDEGFRRAFQRHTGLSPREWRRRAGAGAEVQPA
jgi:AraC-like DNA-binding protein